MRQILRAAVLILPLAGLGWTWHTTRQTALDGVEWHVPVKGYDPRDLLRGHYIRYTYDWPGMTAPAQDTDASGGMTGHRDALCILGRAPDIAETHWLRDGESAPDCAGIVATHAISGVQQAAISGQLYVSQTNASAMQSRLADPKQRGILRFRLRKDGQITPLGLSFRADTASATTR